MPRPQPQPRDICSARSLAQVLSRRICCSVSQPCASVGPALGPDTLSWGTGGVLHPFSAYCHTFPPAAPKLLGTCDGSTVLTLSVPFQQHPCTLSGKFLLCQLPFPPNSDF